MREGGRFSLAVQYANGFAADIDAFYTRGGIRMATEYHSHDIRPHLRLDDLLVEWTDCHYGGSRPWFVCPRKGCGRRAGAHSGLEKRLGEFDGEQHFKPVRFGNISLEQAKKMFNNIKR